MVAPAPLDLHVRDTGAGGPTLVFLHYFAGSSRAWAEVIGRLQPRWRCLAVDLPGFGRSPPADLAPSVAAYADVVARLMSVRGADRYVLVGHSMGGKIASALAARQPRGLEALVLVAPSPLSPEPMEAADRDHLLASHGQPGAAEALLRKITRRPLGADAWIRAVDDNTTTSQAAWRWWLERGGPEDLAPLASSVRVRTLIVAAADDPVLPLHGHQALADRLAGPTRLSTVPDCGHLLPLEAPGETAALIAGFIQAASSPPGEAVTPQGDLHVL